MNYCELVSLVTAASCGIANCATKEELPLIAAVLGQTAATLTTILVIEEEESKAATPLPIEVPDTELDIIPEEY